MTWSADTDFRGLNFLFFLIGTTARAVKVCYTYKVRYVSQLRTSFSRSNIKVKNVMGGETSTKSSSVEQNHHLSAKDVLGNLH